MIGDKIRQLREEKRMTQKDLADALNITPASIGLYEQNRRNPNLELLNKIADFFNVSTDYLLHRTDDRNINIYAKKEIENFTNDSNLEVVALSTRIKDDRELAEKILRILEIIENDSQS